MAVYNSTEYLEEQIEKAASEIRNLKISILKEKILKLYVQYDEISLEEYLFICESLDKNECNLKID